MKEDLEIQARPGNNSQRLKQEDYKFKASLHPWLHRELKGSLGISDKPLLRRKREIKDKKDESVEGAPLVVRRRLRKGAYTETPGHMHTHLEERHVTQMEVATDTIRSEATGAYTSSTLSFKLRDSECLC